MKKETFILKLAIFLMGGLVLALCISGLPWIAKDVMINSPKMVYILYGILIPMYITAIPFFIVLYEGFKLLRYIDRDKAFSELSVKALKIIKRCATLITIIYILIMPLFYVVRREKDAPVAILIGMMFIFAPMVIAVFAAVLEKLLQNAIDIKKDNELTI